MLSIVIQHGDRRAAANLLVRGPGQETTVIAPGCAQSFALDAGQALELTVGESAAPAADEAATSIEAEVEAPAADEAATSAEQPT